MTRVSVIICSYNDGDVLSSAIRSVLLQTVPREQYELVIVDDGSTDETARIVRRFAEDALVKYLRNETNQGLVPAANRGLRTAEGEFVVRLDADDVLAPSALETLLEAADSNDAELVYSDRYEIDEENAVTYVDTGGPLDVFKLIAIGTLFRNNTARDVGGYREVFWEEYDFYIRYLQEINGGYTHVPCPVVVYHQHAGSMTADEGRVRKGWGELVDIWGEERLREYGTLPCTGRTHGS